MTLLVLVLGLYYYLDELVLLVCTLRPAYVVLVDILLDYILVVTIVHTCCTSYTAVKLTITLLVIANVYIPCIRYYLLISQHQCGKVGLG